MKGVLGEWDRLRVKEACVLAALRDPQGLTLKEVSERVGLPSGTVYGILTKLVALGLARRRGGLYFITEKGEEVLKAIKAMLEGVGG